MMEPATIHFSGTQADAARILNDMSWGETILFIYMDQTNVYSIVRRWTDDWEVITNPGEPIVHSLDGVVIPVAELTDGLEVMLEVL
jgi:hypothetical protein